MCRFGIELYRDYIRSTSACKKASAFWAFLATCQFPAPTIRKVFALLAENEL